MFTQVNFNVSLSSETEPLTFVWKLRSFHEFVFVKSKCLKESVWECLLSNSIVIWFFFINVDFRDSGSCKDPLVAI